MNILFFNMAQQTELGQGLLIVKDSWSHSDTLHSVWLLWASDQPHAETSTRQTTLTTKTSMPPAGFETLTYSFKAQLLPYVLYDLPFQSSAVCADSGWSHYDIQN